MTDKTIRKSRKFK